MGTAPPIIVAADGSAPSRLAVVASIVALVLCLGLAELGDGTDGRGAPEGRGAPDAPQQLVVGGGTIAGPRGRAGGGPGPDGGPSGGGSGARPGGDRALSDAAGGAPGAGVAGATGPSVRRPSERSPGAGRGVGGGDGAGTPTPAGGARTPTWRPVGGVDGSGSARSAVFELTGVDARLVVRSNVAIAVHLVSEREGREATAGYAEFDCEAACSEEHVVIAPADRYRLEVDAVGGPWSVRLDEVDRGP